MGAAGVACSASCARRGRMAGPGQWGVKGVDHEAREAARRAAQQAGLPVGVWIERAIRRAATLPEAETVVPSGREPVTASPTKATGPAFADPMPAADVPPEPVPSSAPEPDDTPLGVTVEDAADRIALAPRRSAWPRIAAGATVAAVLVALLAGVGAWVYEALTPPTPSPDPVQRAAAPPAPEAASPAAPALTPPASPDDGALPSDFAALPPDALWRAAELGNVRAQYDLGVRLAAGRGMTQDPAAAARWFERAAVRGLAPAQYNLGVMYDRGLGVARNPALAFFWYESAAEQDYAKAEYNLATAYADGRGTPRDLAKAARWFERAAKSGLAPAQVALATMYERGLGVTRDPARARSLYQAAARQGNADAVKKLASLPPPAIPAVAAAAQPPVVAAMDGTPPLGKIVLDIQRLLKRLRFDPGPVDGAPGPRTREAIALYQQFAGHPATGEPSAALLAELRAVAADMGGK